MKKSKWNNKWQGLSDIHAAKNAAAKTTEESGMMDQSIASDVTITVPPQQLSSTPRNSLRTAHAKRELVWQEYLSLYNEHLQQRYRRRSSSMQHDMDSLSQTYWAAGGFTTPKPTPSSSSTEDSTESCAALKQGPLEVRGATTPSILTGDQPTKPSTSLANVQSPWW